jgi:hypothetical protein
VLITALGSWETPVPRGYVGNHESRGEGGHTLSVVRGQNTTTQAPPKASCTYFLEFRVISDFGFRVFPQGYVHWKFTGCTLYVHWMFTKCSLNVHDYKEKRTYLFSAYFIGAQLLSFDQQRRKP